MTGDAQHAPFGHTQDGDEIFVRRIEFSADPDTDAPRPMPIIERLTASAPSCKGYCNSGRQDCETPAVCSGGDAVPKRLEAIKRSEWAKEAVALSIAGLVLYGIGAGVYHLWAWVAHFLAGA